MFISRCAGSLVVLGLAASPAAGVTASVSGDDANQTPLSAAAPITIRTTSLRVIVTADVADGASRRTSVVLDPAGAPASSSSGCFAGSILPSNTHFVTYRGNGVYTVVVRLFAAGDPACATPTQELRLSFTVAASTAVTAPATPFLIRQPGGFAIARLDLPVSVNPGQPIHEIRYARNGVVGPDGALTIIGDQAFLDASTGTAGFSFREPGRYTVVARVGSGSYFSPWSAPVVVTAIGPFDVDAVRFTDSRGPSYALTGTLREKTARGAVSLAIAKGASGWRFRPIGKASLRNGRFSTRFSLASTGVYRLKITFGGSALVAKGSAVERFRITRSLVFR